MTTGVVYDDVYLEHETGAHPENRFRLTGIVEHLKKTGLWGKLQQIPVRKATVEEVAYIHNPAYIREVEAFLSRGGGYFDMDTPASGGSYVAALTAVGGVLNACDAVMEGKVSNAVCLVRPPGHHATRNQAMGFCIFNNVAIAARHLQKKHNIGKVAIIDWDVHHGNGTQEAFYSDPTVLYVSTHRYPFYPGTGAEEETGAGEGEGYTVNLPFFSADRDEFLERFREAVGKRVEPFAPEFILISAGYDAYENDPIGGLGLKVEDFGTLTEIILGAVRKVCSGRVISTLEGGYNLTDLPKCVEAHIRALMAEK